jgi:hypothetical protein
MRHFTIACALCATALPAAAEETTLYRCLDSQGVVMLTDRPCETVVKEHFVLPPSEQGRVSWVHKPPVSVPPKVDVQTLRMARQALELRDKVASAR